MDANAIMQTHRPVLQLSLREVYRLPQLNEFTYKDMIGAIDPVFLNQERPRPGKADDLPYPGRAGALRAVYYKGFNADTMLFEVTSSEIDKNGRLYQNLIKFLNWDDIASDTEMTPRERALMLLWTSDIQVHCNDPSFLYWGYQYICSQLNAAIYQEIRPPHVRNPDERGIVCKHLNRVLRALPFYNGDIAHVISQQWGGKLDEKAQQAIREREMLQQQMNALPPQQVEPEPPPAPFQLGQPLGNGEEGSEIPGGEEPPPPGQAPLNGQQRPRAQSPAPRPGYGPPPSV